MLRGEGAGREETDRRVSTIVDYTETNSWHYTTVMTIKGGMLSKACGQIKW